MPPAREIPKTDKVLDILWEKRHQTLKVFMGKKALPHIIFLTELLDQWYLSDELFVLGSAHGLSQILQLPVDGRGSAPQPQTMFNIPVNDPFIHLRGVQLSKPYA